MTIQDDVFDITAFVEQNGGPEEQATLERIKKWAYNNEHEATKLGEEKAILRKAVRLIRHMAGPASFDTGIKFTLPPPVEFTLPPSAPKGRVAKEGQFPESPEKRGGK